MRASSARKRRRVSDSICKDRPEESIALVAAAQLYGDVVLDGGGLLATIGISSKNHKMNSITSSSSTSPSSKVSENVTNHSSLAHQERGPQLKEIRDEENEERILTEPYQNPQSQLKIPSKRRSRCNPDDVGSLLSLFSQPNDTNGAFADTHEKSSSQSKKSPCIPIAHNIKSDASNSLNYDNDNQNNDSKTSSFNESHINTTRKKRRRRIHFPPVSKSKLATLKSRSDDSKKTADEKEHQNQSSENRAISRIIAGSTSINKNSNVEQISKSHETIKPDEKMTMKKIEKNWENLNHVNLIQHTKRSLSNHSIEKKNNHNFSSPTKPSESTLKLESVSANKTIDEDMVVLKPKLLPKDKDVIILKRRSRYDPPLLKPRNSNTTSQQITQQNKRGTAKSLEQVGKLHNRNTIFESKNELQQDMVKNMETDSEAKGEALNKKGELPPCTSNCTKTDSKMLVQRTESMKVTSRKRTPGNNPLATSKVLNVSPKRVEVSSASATAFEETEMEKLPAGSTEIAQADAYDIAKEEKKAFVTHQQTSLKPVPKITKTARVLRGQQGDSLANLNTFNCKSPSQRTIESNTIPLCTAAAAATTGADTNDNDNEKTPRPKRSLTINDKQNTPQRKKTIANNNKQKMPQRKKTIAQMRKTTGKRFILSLTKSISSESKGTKSIPSKASLTKQQVSCVKKKTKSMSSGPKETKSIPFKASSKMQQVSCVRKKTKAKVATDMEKSISHRKKRNVFIGTKPSKTPPGKGSRASLAKQLNPNLVSILSSTSKKIIFETEQMNSTPSTLSNNQLVHKVTPTPGESKIGNNHSEKAGGRRSLSFQKRTSSLDSFDKRQSGRQNLLKTGISHLHNEIKKLHGMKAALQRQILMKNFDETDLRRIITDSKVVEDIMNLHLKCDGLRKKARMHTDAPKSILRYSSKHTSLSKSQSYHSLHEYVPNQIRMGEINSFYHQDCINPKLDNTGTTASSLDRHQKDTSFSNGALRLALKRSRIEDETIVSDEDDDVILKPYHLARRKIRIVECEEDDDSGDY